MNKKIVIKLILTIICIISLSLFINQKNADALTLKKGDILTTKSTSASGLSGHNGIYIGQGEVLDTPRAGAYPRVVTSKKWLKSYPKTKVIRPKIASLGNKAANNAVKYFKGKKIPYGISANPRNIKKHIVAN